MSLFNTFKNFMQSKDEESNTMGISDFIKERNERDKVKEEKLEGLQKLNDELFLSACRIVWEMMNETERKNVYNGVSEYREAYWKYMNHVSPGSCEAFNQANLFIQNRLPFIHGLLQVDKRVAG